MITSYNVEWQRGSSTGPWAELAGLSSAYTATTYTTSPGNPAQVVVAGSTYYFRVRAQNAQGWGPYSSAFAILAASVPSQMAMVTIADNSGVPTVRISWSPPTTNGSPLSAYSVEIQALGGAWHTTAECDGSSTAVFSNRYCDVQMQTLRAAPFSLALGAGIVVRAKAQNAIGPATLWSAPTALAAGTQSLTVEMPVVAAAGEGGSPITSYNL